MESRVLKVAVVAPTWLGDAVMSLPLLGYLAAAPEVRATIVARKNAGRVYWGAKGAADIVLLPEEGRLERIARARAVLSRIGADAALLLPPSFSSALGCLLAGVGTRIGVISDGRRLLLTDGLAPGALREEHLSENYLRLGRMLFSRFGIAAERPFTPPRVRSLDRDRSRIAERLGVRGVRPGGYAVVVPGATYGYTKAWPADKYHALARRLSDTLPVVLAGTPAERALCERVGEGIPGAASLAGETTLGELIALLENARVVIANDSGAPHLAASLGAPVVVIFGSTSPRWTAPLGERARVIREPVRCAPCFSKKCPTRLECFEGITVDQVHDAARSFLEEARDVR